MKEVKDTLLQRVSIRRYERERIPQETMDFIYDAVRNTPTSYNGQQFSVIDIDDQELKEKLYALTARSRSRPATACSSSALTTTRSPFLPRKKVLICRHSPTLWTVQLLA